MNRKPYLQCCGEEWDKARMRTLVRDDFTCQFHKLGLSEGDTCATNHPETRLRFLHVHHIQERQHGGTHDLDNLITMCRVHHVMLHPHMRFEFSSRDRLLDAPEMKEL